MFRTLPYQILSFILLPASTGLGLAQNSTARQLTELDSRVLVEHSTEQLSEMLTEDARQRIFQANRLSSSQWSRIENRRQWESFAQEHLKKLKVSLGEFPEISGPPQVHISATLTGDGFRIENLVFESRPGFWVTANLYVPDPLRSSMPGIILSHSHHNPKTQGELQDMGMTWARLGCLVLVMDLVGHGERSDHPFKSPADYAGEFRVGRQDYHFRYNLAIQLYLIGDSLMGWMVHDLKRSVDLLLSRPGIDPGKIILMGSVAGGGDPAAVTSALEKRITAAVPFNFGGPEPESPYPLPNDAEESFNYATSGSWESTRNLRLSARDGFLPWVIVAGIAPRRLVYAHEFSWDRERDPVWKRLERVYGDFYGSADHLAFTHGFGLLSQRPPDASHCNNIGAFHRKRIHTALNNWFQIAGAPEKEFSERRAPEELKCLTEKLIGQLRPLKVHQLAAKVGESRWTETYQRLENMKTDDRKNYLRRIWRGLLGEIDPPSKLQVTSETDRDMLEGGLWIKKAVLEVDPGILVPIILLGSSQSRVPQPVVVCVAQEGKERFLRERSDEVTRLLAGGAAVCLMDLRGTGETVVPGGRSRTSPTTSLAATELMLGQTLVGSRLKDLRAVLSYLRGFPGLDSTRLGIFGDSFAAVNPADANLALPLGIDSEPSISEPLGGVLSLLLALFEDDVQVVYAGGGLLSFSSILSSPFCYVPFDAVIPGAIGAGDLQLLAAALAPVPMMLEGLADGQNRRVEEDHARRIYAPAFEAYRSNLRQFILNREISKPETKVAWLLSALR